MLQCCIFIAAYAFKVFLMCALSIFIREASNTKQKNHLIHFIKRFYRDQDIDIVLDRNEITKVRKIKCKQREMDKYQDLPPLKGIRARERQKAGPSTCPCTPSMANGNPVTASIEGLCMSDVRDSSPPGGKILMPPSQPTEYGTFSISSKSISGHCMANCHFTKKMLLVRGFPLI